MERSDNLKNIAKRTVFVMNWHFIMILLKYSPKKLLHRAFCCRILLAHRTRPVRNTRRSNVPLFFVKVEYCSRSVYLFVYFGTLEIKAVFVKIFVWVVKELEVGTTHHPPVIDFIQNKASTFLSLWIWKIRHWQVVELNQVGMLPMSLVRYA